jgi:uncharacterized membrane protein
MTDAPTPPPSSDTSFRILALLGYGLFVLACTNGFTAIVGVVIAYIKRGEARGTIWESHFSNMIVVFWSAVVVTVAFFAAVAWGAVTIFATDPPRAPLDLIGFGAGIYVGMVAFAVWYLYRTIRGFIRALDGKAYK